MCSVRRSDQRTIFFFSLMAFRGSAELNQNYFILFLPGKNQLMLFLNCQGTAFALTLIVIFILYQSTLREKKSAEIQ